MMPNANVTAMKLNGSTAAQKAAAPPKRRAPWPTKPSYRDKGRDYLKCNCPIWTDGYVNGKRTLRQSLKPGIWPEHGSARRISKPPEPNSKNVLPKKRSRRSMHTV